MTFLNFKIVLENQKLRRLEKSQCCWGLRRNIVGQLTHDSEEQIRQQSLASSRMTSETYEGRKYFFFVFSLIRVVYNPMRGFLGYMGGIEQNCPFSFFFFDGYYIITLLYFI